MPRNRRCHSTCALTRWPMRTQLKVLGSPPLDSPESYRKADVLFFRGFTARALSPVR
jgi:hypothetical protein